MTTEELREIKPRDKEYRYDWAAIKVGQTVFVRSFEPKEAYRRARWSRNKWLARHPEAMADFAIKVVDSKSSPGITITRVA